MNRLLLLLLIMSSHLMYAGNFGVTPASTSPVEHRTSKTASATKHNKKGKLSLFRHKKQSHLFKKHNVKRGIKPTNLGLFLSNLVWVFIVLGLYALIILGIVLSMTWLWFIALGLLAIFSIIFKYIIMPASDSSEAPYNIVDLAAEPYFYSAIIGGFVVGAIVLGLLLNIVWLWALTLSLIGLALLIAIIWFIVWVIQLNNDPNFMKF